MARAGRDAPGTVMDLNVVIDDTNPDVTVRAPAQTRRAVIGGGPHRIAISYRAEGTATANAETRFLIYSSTIGELHEVLRAPLPAAQGEFAATTSPRRRNCRATCFAGSSSTTARGFSICITCLSVRSIGSRDIDGGPDRAGAARTAQLGTSSPWSRSLPLVGIAALLP